MPKLKEVVLMYIINAGGAAILWTLLKVMGLSEESAFTITLAAFAVGMYLSRGAILE